MFQTCRFQNSFNYEMFLLFHLALKIGKKFNLRPPVFPKQQLRAGGWKVWFQNAGWAPVQVGKILLTMHGKYSQVTQLFQSKKKKPFSISWVPRWATKKIKTDWKKISSLPTKPSNQVAWVSLPNPLSKFTPRWRSKLRIETCKSVWTIGKNML